MTNIIGTNLQGYQVLEEMGSPASQGQAGTNSQVFKAIDPNSDNLVAIKLFPTEVAQDRQLLLRLRDSQRAVTRMNHPNILPIIGSGMFAGRPYIVMPYIATGSLLNRFESGAISVLDVEQVIVEVASALEHAHSCGVVHGDLKPSEILFNENGQVHVVGFGQAPILGSLLQTSKPEPGGGEAYQAPEVLKGEGMTASSDQYSLALIALEMLTDLPAGEALKALRNRQQRSMDSPTRPRRLQIDLPQKVIDVLFRALIDNPGHRFASVAEMKRAYQAARGFEAPPTAETLPAPRQDLPPRRRRRISVIGLAATLAVTLCFVVTMPALSSAWKGIQQNIFSTRHATETSPGAKDLQSSPVLDSIYEDLKTATSDPTRISQDITGENAQKVETIESEGLKPSATEEASSVKPAEATNTLPVENTLTTTPTATMAPSSTQSPSPTQAPSLTPSTIPTIKNCSDKPGHPHYCTPTAEP
jgi:serine/threonine protein kinase